MKQILTLITCLLFTGLAYGQTPKIKERKIDAISGDSIIRSTYINLRPLVDFKRHSYLAKVNLVRYSDEYYLNLNIMFASGIEAVREGADLIFKLQDDSLVTLKALRYEIGRDITINFIIHAEQLSAIKNKGVKLMRLYCTDGYVEDGISENCSKSFSKLISLFNIE